MHQGVPVCVFAPNDAHPPLPFPDESFDLIYATSVFTHLDERLQFEWLSELQRVSQPGGIVLLTTHGERYRDHRSWSANPAELADRGFVFQRIESGTFRLNGLPEYYQATYQTRQYVEKTWGAWFDIVGYYELGLNQDQDIVVLSKRRP